MHLGARFRSICAAACSGKEGVDRAALVTPRDALVVMPRAKVCSMRAAIAVFDLERAILSRKAIVNVTRQVEEVEFQHVHKLLYVTIESNWLPHAQIPPKHPPKANPDRPHRVISSTPGRSLLSRSANSSWKYKVTAVLLVGVCQFGTLLEALQVRAKLPPQPAFPHSNLTQLYEPRLAETHEHRLAHGLISHQHPRRHHHHHHS